MFVASKELYHYTLIVSSSLGYSTLKLGCFYFISEFLQLFTSYKFLRRNLVQKRKKVEIM